MGHVLAVDDDLLAEVEGDEGGERRGAVHQRRGGEEDEALAARGHPLRQFLGALHGFAGRRAAAEAGEEQVLLAPHHALGHAGGAAGVDDDLVVRGPGAEAAAGRTGRFGFGEADRRDTRFRRALGGLADAYEVAQPLRAGDRRRDACGELPVEDERHQVRVPVQVGQLPLDVAVVDVDRYGADLQAGPERLEVLDAVVEVQADVFAGPYAALVEVVGEPVGRRVELGVGQPAFGPGPRVIGEDQRLAVGHGVDDRFEEVGKVVLHVSSRSGLTDRG